MKVQMIWVSTVAVAMHSGVAAAQLQLTTEYGIEFTTISSPGNAPWIGDPELPTRTSGRGSVDYEYRIGVTEITSAQWLDFVNTFSMRDDDPHRFYQVHQSGIRRDNSYSGPGFRHILDPSDPNAGMRPVFGIDWRHAAMYANWLHNDQSTDLSAIENGAYDTSTFTNRPGGEDDNGGQDGPNMALFNDQHTRNPDARFWIPSLDEWLKAAHFDPDKNGQGPGWWEYSHTSDTAPISGYPGIGETTGGIVDDTFIETIPLGAYPDVQSPWGLLDTSGGASEWNEEVFFPGHERSRGYEGSRAGEEDYELIDSIFSTGGGGIGGGFDFSFRIAAAVPSPSSVGALLMAGVFISSSRRRMPS